MIGVCKIVYFEFGVACENQEAGNGVQVQTGMHDYWNMDGDTSGGDQLGFRIGIEV